MFEQPLALQQIDHIIEQRFDLEQHQRIELVQQCFDGADAVGGGDDGDGVIGIGQWHAKVGRCGMVGGDAGDGLDAHSCIERGHGTRQMAKGGIG